MSGDDRTERSLTRRGALRGASALGALGAGLATARPAEARADIGDGGRTEFFDHDRGPDPARIRRRALAFRQRVEIARDRLKRDLTVHPRNDDEETDRYGRFVIGGETFDNPIASYAKGLPKDQYGETSREDYDALRAALNRFGDLKPREFDERGQFEDVELGGVRTLAQPEAALSYTTDGFDTHDVYHEPAPNFESKETAAEMVELYWQALLRDVPFQQYEDSRKAQAAADELDSLEGYNGPTDENGNVTPSVLFRGTTPGCLEGPHLSQFLYKDFVRGMRERDQRLTVAEPGLDYMTDYDDWLAVQEGGNPYGTSFREQEAYAEERYMVTGRDMATYVHRNAPAQPYVAAFFILAGSGVPLNPESPYPTENQNNFIDHGARDALPGLNGIDEEALLVGWYHKWVVHRRPRPEELGGRVYWTLRDEGPDYPLDADLLESEAVARTNLEFGSRLLPQGYPEGSPIHPAFPAGHATEAGSMGTLLKAYFDDEATVPDPRKPDPADPTYLTDYEGELTVKGEVNKLVANMTIGRNWAGIHYRTDAIDGIRAGERLAAGWILDRVNSKARDGAVSFETFDGERVRIETGDEELPDPLQADDD